MVEAEDCFASGSCNVICLDSCSPSKYERHDDYMFCYDIAFHLGICYLIYNVYRLQNDEPSSFGVDIISPSDVHAAIVTTDNR